MSVSYISRHERSKHPDEVPYEETNQMPEEQITDDESQDYVKKYHSARLTFGLLMMLFSDSVKEGDSAI